MVDGIGAESDAVDRAVSRMASHAGERSRDDRVPPHNLEAEAAIIGAALIAPDAVDKLVATTDPRDYYAPKHQHIAGAIHHLAATGQAVDVITVADILKRGGLLDDVGGADYLHDLQNAVPAISAAAHYGRLIQEASTLRRLISAASDIQHLAYSTPDDPRAAVNRAGEILDSIAGDALAHLSAVEVADLAALLETDLEPEAAVILRRTDGGALIYPGKVHGFHAEPTSGKSWVALAACVEILNLGGACIYIDYEDTAGGIVRRLLNLGANPAAIVERFVYMQIMGRYGAAERKALDAYVDRLNPDLVIIDGLVEALSREGFSEDNADDVIRWAEMLPRPLARMGSAVVILDHVAKDPEQRGRWARGTGAKLGLVDGAQYQVKVRVAFSRHRAGRVDLVIAKDRPGGVGAMGETAAQVHIEPHAGGERVVMRFEPHSEDVAPTDSWRPTMMMGRLFDELQRSAQPLSPTGLQNLVHGKPATKREALARLQQEGYVELGAGKPSHLRILKPWDHAGPPPNHEAPAWRTPPPELEFEAGDEPTSEELAELDRQRFHDRPEF